MFRNPDGQAGGHDAARARFFRGRIVNGANNCQKGASFLFGMVLGIWIADSFFVTNCAYPGAARRDCNVPIAEMFVYGTLGTILHQLVDRGMTTCEYLGGIVLGATLMAAGNLSQGPRIQSTFYHS